MNEEQRAYLQRIRYIGDLQPTLENLRAIHRAHMLAVPFENLDIHIGRWIALDEEKIFHKIVNEHRGGFCFEQNGLFHKMLRSFGYDVIRIEANVRSSSTGNFGVAMGHMALIVQLEGKRWLCDVGFGDSFLEPLQIDTTEAQLQDGQAYKIEHDGSCAYMMQQDADGNWSVQYRFFFTPHKLEDYTDACHYMQTSPETHFTQKRICSLATPTGRISLSDNLFITTVHGQREERELTSESQISRMLQEHFQVTLPPGSEDVR